jgi:hypothetical protein
LLERRKHGDSGSPTPRPPAPIDPFDDSPLPRAHSSTGERRRNKHTVIGIGALGPIPRSPAPIVATVDSIPLASGNSAAEMFAVDPAPTDAVPIPYDEQATQRVASGTPSTFTARPPSHD